MSVILKKVSFLLLLILWIPVMISAVEDTKADESTSEAQGCKEDEGAWNDDERHDGRS